ncbi:hypothetical protein [Sphaerimonospora thailandensis]|uniref:hypothetical protein n=1 Tax=Sphaerimonospora thailandensis TaxID=795644 RepID=UPI0019514D99|nr:hypothetical protein [Sphaerimonospora thailandensis]
MTFILSVDRAGTSTGLPDVAAFSQAALSAGSDVASGCAVDAAADAAEEEEEVGGGVGPWAIAGALTSESGSIRAVIRAARWRVRTDKPDADRHGFTHSLSNICEHVFGNGKALLRHDGRRS